MLSTAARRIPAAPRRVAAHIPRRAPVPARPFSLSTPRFDTPVANTPGGANTRPPRSPRNGDHRIGRELSIWIIRWSSAIRGFVR